MPRGTPSLLALLGLLAVAGYQNRDKIAEMLQSGSRDDTPGMAPGPEAGKGGILGNLGGILGAGGSIGGMLSGGIGELVDRFRKAGHGDVAESWVKTGPNRPVTASEFEAAIGEDVLSKLMAQTRLSREELIARLTTALPDAVDRYTPDGKLP